MVYLCLLDDIGPENVCLHFTIFKHFKIIGAKLLQLQYNFCRQELHTHKRHYPMHTYSGRGFKISFPQTIMSHQEQNHAYLQHSFLPTNPNITQTTQKKHQANSSVFYTNPSHLPWPIVAMVYPNHVTKHGRSSHIPQGSRYVLRKGFPL